MNQEDILRETIRRVEKIRYQCMGLSATAECIIYVKSNNEIMMIHDNRTIFYTYIPEYFKVHQELSYKRSIMLYDDKKEPILDNLTRLDLFNIERLNYCKAKYDEYILAMNRCNVIAQEDDLSTNPSFQELYKVRSSDGLKYFYVSAINNTIIGIPYFVGLYGIKKSDKYGIAVYDFDKHHFLVRITDKKPKLNMINIFISILKGI